MPLSARVTIPSGGFVPVVSAAVFSVMGQNMGQDRTVSVSTPARFRLTKHISRFSNDKYTTKCVILQE